MIFENRWSQFHKCPRMSDRKCAGDTCAAWRWFDPPEPDPIIIDHADPLATVEPTDRPADVPKGYEFFLLPENMTQFGQRLKNQLFSAAVDIADLPER